MTAPLPVRPLQVKSPVELLLVKIERQQAVETGRCQEDAPLDPDDLMTVLQVAVAVRAKLPEIPVIDE
jgi:hypothetical protein